MLPPIIQPLPWNATDSGGNSLLSVRNDGATTINGQSVATAGVVLTVKGAPVAGGQMWIAVGAGTNSIAWSTNGTSWTGLGTTIFSNQGSGIAWNGTMWVAVGQGTNTIAYSYDGKNWTGLGTSIFSAQGDAIAWNGSYWIAVGDGGSQVAKSTDGIHWSGGTIASFTPYGLAWNGTMWVAVGTGNAIQYIRLLMERHGQVVVVFSGPVVYTMLIA